MDHINNCLLSGPRLPPLSTPSSYCCSCWTLRSPAFPPPPPPTSVSQGSQGTGWSPLLSLCLLAEVCFFLTWLAANDSSTRFNENQVLCGSMAE